MKISLIYRYPDLKQRFLEAQADDDLDDSLNQPKYLEIYAEAQERYKREQEKE